MPGVIKIVPLATNYGHGFGVIAENTWAAFKAAEAIEAEWDQPEYPLDSAAVSKVLTDRLSSPDGTAMRDDGDVDAAFADAPRERIVEADYSAPYLAHAAMEPMNATARLQGWCARHLGRQPGADDHPPALRRCCSVSSRTMSMCTRLLSAVALAGASRWIIRSAPR